MKTNNLLLLSLLLIFSVQVVAQSGFRKRKYTKGFFHERIGKLKHPKATGAKTIVLPQPEKANVENVVSNVVQSERSDEREVFLSEKPEPQDTFRCTGPNSSEKKTKGIRKQVKIKKQIQVPELNTYYKKETTAFAAKKISAAHVQKNHSAYSSNASYGEGIIHAIGLFFKFLFFAFLWGILAICILAAIAYLVPALSMEVLFSLGLIIYVGGLILIGNYIEEIYDALEGFLTVLAIVACIAMLLSAVYWVVMLFITYPIFATTAALILLGFWLWDGIPEWREKRSRR